MQTTILRRSSTRPSPRSSRGGHRRSLSLALCGIVALALCFGASAVAEESSSSLDAEAREILTAGRYQTEPPMLRPSNEPIEIDAPMLGLVLKLLLFAAIIAIVLTIVAFLVERKTRVIQDQHSFSGPEGSNARAIPRLEEAESRAAEGRFGDAAHILLQVAIAAIERSGEPIRQSQTSRELIRRLTSTDPKREPLALLVRVVEDHLFRGLEIASDRYERCLEAYRELSGHVEAEGS